MSFYLSPIYSHQELYTNISNDLKKVLKGKSCFNISNANYQLLDEIEEVLKRGINKYEEIGWI